MNTYYVNDTAFIKTEAYKNFFKENSSKGFLKIRAYAASQAIPISGLKVIVSKNIDNNKIIFFEGSTNESGVIEKIVLPTSTIANDDESIPNSTSYDITATYVQDNINTTYKVNIYENIYVVQNINIVPKANLRYGV